MKRLWVLYLHVILIAVLCVFTGICYSYYSETSTTLKQLQTRTWTNELKIFSLKERLAVFERMQINLNVVDKSTWYTVIDVNEQPWGITDK